MTPVCLMPHTRCDVISDIPNLQVFHAPAGGANCTVRRESICEGPNIIKWRGRTGQRNVSNSAFPIPIVQSSKAQYHPSISINIHQYPSSRYESDDMSIHFPCCFMLAHHQAKATEGALAAPSGVVRSHMKVGDLRGEKLEKSS